MASTTLQNIIIISACLFVATATRSDDSSELKTKDDFYTDTDDGVTGSRGKYYDYYSDIVFRDKLLRSLFGSGIPVDDYLSNRDTDEESLARQIALGDNNDAFNSLTNKREDERIDNFNTQQDDASEIPKKFNDQIDLDKTGHKRGSGVSERNDNKNKKNKSDVDVQRQINDIELLRKPHKVNSTDTDNVISVEKRPRFRNVGRGPTADSCTMDMIYMNIQFEEEISTQDGSSMLLICTGGVTVNKCEGSCRSSVTPTLSSPDGYTRVRSLSMLF